MRVLAGSWAPHQHGRHRPDHNADPGPEVQRRSGQGVCQAEVRVPGGAAAASAGTAGLQSADAANATNAAGSDAAADAGDAPSATAATTSTDDDVKTFCDLPPQR